MPIKSNNPRVTEDFDFASGLSKSQLIEIDACTRCGACLSECPIQDATGDTSISPPDKIAMFRSFLQRTKGLQAKLMGPPNIPEEELKHFSRALWECTTCGRCGEMCEAGIFSQRLWPFLRAKMVDMGYGPWEPQNMMEKVTLETGNVYNQPAEKRYDWWPEDCPTYKDQAEIAYYTGCTTAYESQPMAIGDVRMLTAAKIDYMMLPPEREICCGFPLFASGQHKIIPDLVRPVIQDYKDKGVKTLISSCPCCCNIMTRDWPRYWGGELPFKIRHMTQFILGRVKDGTIKFNNPLNEKIVYDDPCYLARGVGITEEPRDILKELPGVDLAEFEQNRMMARCCGAGGAVKKVFSENAIKMGRIALDETKELGAKKLVLSCPACYQKVNEANEGYLSDELQVIDIMELCSQHLEPGSDPTVDETADSDS